MDPSRILPDLQCALVCEDVRQEVTGNFMLMGVIGQVKVQQFPITAFKLCVFVRWTSGLGAFQQNVRLLAPDQATLLRDSQVKFNLHDISQAATNVTVFGQARFDAPGVYYIEILVDDVMKLRFPLPFIQVQPPPEQQESAPAQTQ